MAGHRLKAIGMRGPSCCLVCGGFIGVDMPADCPNRLMTPMESTNIYEGKLNFINGQFMWAPNVVEVAAHPEQVSVSWPVLN